MPNKIKVLQFSIAASAGGRTQFLLNLWEEIDKNRFSFDFITFSKKLDFEDDLIKTGANVFHISNYPEDNLEGFTQEFQKILSNGYDVIHIATSFWKNTIIEKLAKQAGIKKIIIHSHSSGINAVNISDNNALNTHMYIKNHLNEEIATDYIACSKSAAEWLFGNQIPENKIQIIHNGIDSERFKYNMLLRKIIRSKFNLDKYYVLGFVGRLEMVKNIDFIIKLLKDLLIYDVNIRLVIIGNGSQKRQLEEKANELGLTEYVLFLGQIKQVEQYLMAFDVFLLPSIFEGFPISLLEAQCAGLKSLVSLNVTEEAIISDLVHRINIDNKKEWIDSLLKIKQGYERKDYSEVIKDNNLDTKQIVKQYEKIYTEGICS